ncbi:MAG TPA: ferritin-like domain-containing protein, partial [Dehalococcoidia bacterium]|nr:ferritin-like domain-containing protein [Dehalococcoidia bacterium]
QYMLHHVMGRGLASPAVLEMFKSHAMDEMKHAYAIIERVDVLGGTPTSKVGPVQVGGDLRKMIADDLEGERRAVDMYRGYVKLAVQEDDPVTRRLFEDLLATEEGHTNDWETVLE